MKFFERSGVLLTTLSRNAWRIQSTTYDNRLRLFEASFVPRETIVQQLTNNNWAYAEETADQNLRHQQESVESYNESKQYLLNELAEAIATGQGSILVQNSLVLTVVEPILLSFNIDVRHNGDLFSEVIIPDEFCLPNSQLPKPEGLPGHEAWLSQFTAELKKTIAETENPTKTLDVVKYCPL